MSRLMPFLLLLPAVLAYHGQVLELNQQSLDPTLTSGKTLLEFYAPWCGHCQQFAPAYKEVAKELAADDVRIARIDGSKYRMASFRFRIRGFPTFFLVDKDEVKQYTGMRSKEGMVEFARNGKEGIDVGGGWKKPMGVYWKGVARVFAAWERGVAWMEEKKISKTTMISAGAGMLVTVLGAFVVCIYLVTKPQVTQKPKTN